MTAQDRQIWTDLWNKSGGDISTLTPEEQATYLKHRLADMLGSGSWFQSKIAGMIGAVVVFLNKSFFQKILISWATTAVMWSFHAMVKASPGRAFDLMKKINQAYYSPPAAWAAFIAGYIEQMTGSKISLDDIVGGPVGASGRAAIEKLGEAFVTPLLGLIMPQPPITPQDGVDAAERYLGVNLQFQMSSWFLHVMGDMMSFGIFKSLKDLPNAISWSFGLGWLSWLVMGTPFQMGISDPLREHFNRVYKPSRFSVSQNIEAFRKGYITSSEFVDNCRFLGWDDTKIEMLYKMSRKEITEASLKKLYSWGVIDKNDVKQEVEGRGYTGAAVDAIVFMITNERLIDCRDDLLKELENLYVAGEMTTTSMKDAYTRAGFNSNEISLKVQTLDAEKHRKSTLSDSDIANAVEKNLMAWAQGRTILQNRGYTRSDADIFLKLRIPKSLWI